MFFFGGTGLHPTTLLIGWLAAVLAIQFFAFPLILGVVLALLLLARGALAAWWQYISRARWLVLALWLVLAYSAAGEAMFDVDWAPTREGASLASLQVMRLVAMLGFLACLFRLLGRVGLVAALWGLLRPLGRCGVDSDRLVVRLSLVLEHLKVPLKKGAWRRMLMHEPLAEGPETLLVSLPKWKAIDTLTVTVVLFALLGCVTL